MISEEPTTRTITFGQFFDFVKQNWPLCIFLGSIFVGWFNIQADIKTIKSKDIEQDIRIQANDGDIDSIKGDFNAVKGDIVEIKTTLQFIRETLNTKK